MSSGSGELAQILARLDSIEKKSNKPAWWGVGVAILAAMASLVAGYLLAHNTLKASEKQADALMSSTSDSVSGDRAAFVASQRRDSYATLGRTVRDQVRILQLARTKLEIIAKNPELGRPRPLNAVVGTAYRTTRGVAVDTELVGDVIAGQMARCIVAGILHIGEDLENLQAAVEARAATKKGATGGERLLDDLDRAQKQLRKLQKYEAQFITHGADNLFPDETTSSGGSGKDPNCLWPRPWQDD